MTNLEEDLTYHQAHIENIVKMYRDEYMGVLVKLTRGKYQGRTAKIKGIIADDSRILFLCMVLRADGKGVLNSDGETRTYRPREEFEYDK